MHFCNICIKLRWMISITYKSKLNTYFLIYTLILYIFNYRSYSLFGLFQKTQHRTSCITTKNYIHYSYFYFIYIYLYIRIIITCCCSTLSFSRSIFNFDWFINFGVNFFLWNWIDLLFCNILFIFNDRLFLDCFFYFWFYFWDLSFIY
jgi:hypothetical protein